MKYRLVVSHPDQERAYQVMTTTYEEAERLLDKRGTLPAGTEVQIFETREYCVLARTVGE